MENEELRAERAREQLHQLGEKPRLVELALPEAPALQDYQVLMEAVVALAAQVAGEQEAQPSVEEAQRIVIRSLALKLGELQGGAESLEYMPSEAQDRKLWYLELLEQ